MASDSPFGCKYFVLLDAGRNSSPRGLLTCYTYDVLRWPHYRSLFCRSVQEATSYFYNSVDPAPSRSSPIYELHNREHQRGTYISSSFCPADFTMANPRSGGRVLFHFSSYFV